jgi:peptidoglycan/xylan/chitin deacetylase (PgdA/CDA1 family)
LAGHGWNGTFFVLMAGVRLEAELWQAVAAAGHEIGNHTVSHPCSGNFPWSRANALEDYTLARLAEEVDAASAEIETFFGRRPTSFAYCCGQKFVGRGPDTRSYVPLVAERFTVGRGFGDEFPNDPTFVDLAQVAGVPADALGRRRLIALAEQAAREGSWLVLVGHDVGRSGRQTVVARELHAFCRWVAARDYFWVAPVTDVGLEIRSARTESAG